MTKPFCVIHNLTTKQRVLMETVWAMDDITKARSFMTSLPAADQRDLAAIIKMAEQRWNDDVEDVSQAAEIIDKIRSR